MSMARSKIYVPEPGDIELPTGNQTDLSFAHQLTRKEIHNVSLGGSNPHSTAIPSTCVFIDKTYVIRNPKNTWATYRPWWLG